MESEFVHERDGIWRCNLDGLLYRPLCNLLPVSFENGEIVGDRWPRPRAAAEDIDDLVRGEWDGVKSVLEIARNINRDRKSVTRVCERLGLETKQSTKDKSAEITPKILSMFGQGKSASEVARELGVSPSVVARTWRKNNLTSPIPRKTITDELRADIRKLKGKLSSGKAAEMFGLNYKTVLAIWKS
jgi:DNA invertase Pin-like site-specific DNA recombinase